MISDIFFNLFPPVEAHTLFYIIALAIIMATIEYLREKKTKTKQETQKDIACVGGVFLTILVVYMSLMTFFVEKMDTSSDGYTHRFVTGVYLTEMAKESIAEKHYTELDSPQELLSYFGWRSESEIWVLHKFTCVVLSIFAWLTYSLLFLWLSLAHLAYVQKE